MNTNKFLVFRFSSFGDVAMTVPVIKSVIEQNPSIEITMVSNKNYEVLFEGIPRLQFIGVDFSTYKGISGLFRLYKELRIYRPSALIDLHQVLRTKILKFFFRFSSVKSFTLDKGRKEKKELTRKKDKKLRPLRTMHERYADVFREAGIPVVLPTKKITLKEINQTIGIAPFARYQEKMYPLEKMKTLCLELAQQGKKVILFGGKGEERDELLQWENLHPNISSLAGKVSLKEEIEGIKNLDVLISMDSANMHLASMVGTPCVSIWGATHPFAGFLGFNQSEDRNIQADLECRPCSVFGNKKCYRGDLLCMNSVSEEDIIKKISG